MEDSKDRLVISISIILVGIAVCVLYFAFTGSKGSKEEVKEIKKDEKVEEVEDDLPKCTGKYYGEATGRVGRVRYDYKYTYVLNKDYTFTYDLGDSNGNGIFTINDNTISFITKQDIIDRENETSYKTVDYVISDDCTYIRVNNGTTTFDLKQEN